MCFLFPSEPAATDVHDTVKVNWDYGSKGNSSVNLRGGGTKPMRDKKKIVITGKLYCTSHVALD